MAAEGTRLNLPLGAFRYISGLARTAKKAPLLVICDDLQAWDSASLRLLKMMLSEQALREFSFLADFKFLLLHKSLEGGEEWIEDALSKPVPSVELLHPLTEQLPEILRQFGGDCILEPSLVGQIRTITGGHLSLLKNVALLINGASACSLEELEQLLRSRQDILSEAITKRLQSIPEGDLIKRILIAAAVIGETFDDRELNCISRGTDAERRSGEDPVYQALAHGLLSKADNRYAFEHDIVRKYFLDCGESESVLLNERFADCLRMLRPGAYLQRAKHLKQARQENKALVIEGLDLLRSAEEGEPILDSKVQQIFGDLITRGEIRQSQLMKVLLGAIRALAAGNVRDAYDQIRSLSANDQCALEGWRLYLSVRCAIKTRTRGDIRAWLEESQSRNEFVQEEFDVWMRVKGAEIIALVYLGDHLAAMREYYRLQDALSKRIAFDPSAGFHIAVLQRKSPSLFDSQRSVPECEKSIAFFRPENEQDLPLYPRQLFMARTNLAGSLISAGRFNDAVFESEAAIRLHRLIPGVQIPGIKLALSNHLVASYLAGALPPEDALTQYQHMVDAFSGNHDKYLLENNLAVFLAANGAIESACAGFRALLETIELDGADDSYYIYWAASNAAWACLELQIGGEAYWQIACRNQECVHSVDQKFLKVRHRVLERFLGKGFRPDQEDLDSAFEKAGCRLDSPWRFWGRAYLPSDVHFWSSS